MQPALEMTSNRPDHCTQRVMHSLKRGTACVARTGWSTAKWFAGVHVKQILGSGIGIGAAYSMRAATSLLGINPAFANNVNLAVMGEFIQEATCPPAPHPFAVNPLTAQCQWIRSAPVSVGSEFIRSFLVNYCSVQGCNVNSQESLALSGVQTLIPLFEETVFRLVTQDLLLRRLPKRIFRKYPTALKAIDSKLARVFRVVITSALFSYYHLFLNASFLSPISLKIQLIQTFVLGLWLGTVKETRLGFWGALGLHRAVNINAMASIGKV